MRIYKSTAGCGHGQYAYVIRVAKNGDTWDYLCIWTNEFSDIPVHEEGAIIAGLEDTYVEKTTLSIEDFPIAKTFLFKYFMENYTAETPALYSPKFKCFKEQYGGERCSSQCAECKAVYKNYSI
jgi:hypothetical protein